MATVKLNRDAVRELLRSGPIVADLMARGHRIAVQADSAAASAIPWDPSADAPAHKVTSFIGKNRGRVTVDTGNPEAMIAEARHRTLTRSIDAGR